MDDENIKTKKRSPSLSHPSFPYMLKMFKLFYFSVCSDK